MHSCPRLPTVTGLFLPVCQLLPSCPGHPSVVGRGGQPARAAAPQPAHVRWRQEMRDQGIMWRRPRGILGKGVTEHGVSGLLEGHREGTASTEQATFKLRCWWNHLLSLIFCSELLGRTGKAIADFLPTRPPSHHFDSPNFNAWVSDQKLYWQYCIKLLFLHTLCLLIKRLWLCVPICNLPFSSLLSAGW